MNRDIFLYIVGYLEYYPVILIKIKLTFHAKWGEKHYRVITRCGKVSEEKD